jgi:adenylate cyclase
MHGSDIERITAWLIERGLGGAAEADMLAGFCERCCEAGLPLSRAVALIDTLHPVHEGRAFRWRNDGVEENAVIEYGRTNAGGEAAANWQASVFYHLLATGGDELRRRLRPGDPADFPLLETMKAEGQTDSVSFVHRFPRGGAIGEMDCVYSHWLSRHREGFAEADLAALRRLLPPFALALKSASLARIASTLVEVYLGRGAGRRVLSGRIVRGVADRIGAVLWFSDLEGYTTIADTASPDEIIPLLNDYAEAVIAAVHEAGGDVLKLVGDGILAIFEAGDPADACRCALRAEAALRLRAAALDERRSAEGRPVTGVYLGLHFGDVFLGNIGSEDRLDFTVVGPAVNEVSRIASMCRSADRSVLLSAAFVAATPEPERSSLVSVGRYALRGVGRAQELFTLDPGAL